MELFIKHVLFTFIVLGTLRFGLIDVTEAQLGIILVHVVSGLFGVDFWTKSVREED